MAYNLDKLRNERGVITPFAMMDPNLLTPSKKKLRKVKRKQIKFHRDLKRSGYITKQEFKEIKKEIKKYTDY